MQDQILVSFLYIPKQISALAISKSLIVTLEESLTATPIDEFDMVKSWISTLATSPTDSPLSPQFSVFMNFISTLLDDMSKQSFWLYQ